MRLCTPNLLEEEWVDLYHSTQNEAEKVESDIRRRVGNGQIFSAFFIKRTNLRPRHMVCRLGVQYDPDKEGGPPRSWSPSDHRLLQVFDMQKGQYRFINLPKVLWVKAGGDLIIYSSEYYDLATSA